MILPASWTIKIFGDDSFDLAINWKDPVGVLHDLTGWTAFMEFFQSKAHRAPLLKRIESGQGENESGITLGNTEPNIFVFIQNDETGIGADPKFSDVPGYYVLHLVPGIPTVDRLIKGRVKYEL